MCTSKLTLIQIYTPNKRYVHAQTTMTSTALQTNKGAHGERSGRRPGRRFDEGCPSRLTFRAVAADLIFGPEHQDLEAPFEISL